MKSENKKLKGWYIVFINALVGCCIAATFPQFSMVVGELSVVSGISESLLLASDTIKSVGIVISMLVSGVLYNRFGGRKLFIYSTLAASIPQFLLPNIDSAAFLMALKFIQGTAAVMFPVFIVIIMNWMDKKDAGLSTAIFNGIFYGGGGIGGTFAGIVITKSDWTMSFYAMAFIQIVVGIVWLMTVKEKPDELRSLPTDNEAHPKNKNQNLLRTGKVWLLSIGFLATTWTVQAITVDMSLFSTSLGYSEAETGVLLTAVTIGMIVSCLISGKTSDFFAKRAGNKGIARLTVLMSGYVILVLSIILILFMDKSIFGLFYLAVLLLTFGGSWGLGAFYSILPELYDEGSVPVVTGITGGIGDMGMPISPLVVGVVFGIKGMWNIAWGTCGFVALIGIASVLLLIFSLKKNSLKEETVKVVNGDYA